MELWPHQRAALDFLHDHPRAMLWHEPRLGKTRTILTEIQRLQPHRALIVCPKTVASVWEQESATLEMSITNLSDGLIASRTLPNEGIVVLNYDALWPMRDRLARWNPGYVCADEIHLAKSAGAHRSRALAGVSGRATFVRGLSGTPTPQSYKDLYAQYRAVAPGIFGTRLQDFTDRYCILHPKWPSKVIGYRRLDELRTKAFSIAHRVSREQALGVPVIQDIVRRVTLPETSVVGGVTYHPRHIYDQLVQAYVAPDLTATHALTRALRLAQITAGILPSDFGDERWIHNAKVDAVVGELSEPLEAGEKAVVFYRFRLEGMKLALATGGTLLSGDTPQERRTQIIADFNTKPQPNVLICQEQLGLGVSFRAASIAVFSSSSFDYAVRVQCRDRIYDGPTKPRTYVNLVCPHTIDAAIEAAHAKKQSLSEHLLDIGFDAAATGEDNARSTVHS